MIAFPAPVATVSTRTPVSDWIDSYWTPDRYFAGGLHPIDSDGNYDYTRSCVLGLLDVMPLGLRAPFARISTLITEELGEYLMELNDWRGQEYTKRVIREVEANNAVQAECI